MVDLNCRRFDRQSNNTPILSNKEIDHFAHAVLADYKPTLLQEPGKIRFEHFLESYLGATVVYYDIWSDDPERPIWGATAFKDEELKVFDRENMCTTTICIPARTVVIDNSVIADGEGGRALFTGLHEGGHLLIHPGVYAAECEEQISLIDNSLSPVVCCRRNNIENFGTVKRTKTAAEWREHHADYFAAALAMPNATFIPFAGRLLHKYEVRKGRIVTGVDEDLDYLAEELLPEEISEVYGVSKRAAFVKLKKSGFVMDKKAYEYDSAQLTM